jgi:hypothetical protein
VTRKMFIFLILILLFLGSGAVLAQIYSGRSRQFGGGRSGRGGRTGQAYPGQRSGGRGRQLPNQQFLNSNENLFTWPVDPEFKDDTFTFVRIEYSGGPTGRGSYGRSNFGFGSFRGGRGGFGGYGGSGSRWRTDYPDSDNNFSFRLHQVTSIEVNPEPVVLQITNPQLFNYPFIYIVEPGSLYLQDDEVKILRKYLLNGGFLMLDDFWGRAEWYNVYSEMKKVFPEREPRELTLDDPIFHSVFEIKEMPQIPAYNIAVNLSTDTLTGITTERNDAPRAIFYGIYDDKGRMMVIIDRDTDLGDGWEREGTSKAYFSEFSEKKAYPLGINIIFYVMTH